uniref:Uncharacterized protein n=1 Tax=Anguilla anguilla TaxID=7936 RepID=A0A0E9TND6_ANGAN
MPLCIPLHFLMESKRQHITLKTANGRLQTLELENG